jgi:LysR family hydrogen peroxide-inducible transcriptional activator
MELHQIRYFCAVARTASFTRAAHQEHIAQPSLSLQIRKLEDELGTKLFDRLGRTVRLTQFGEAFLPRAEAIVRQVFAAKHEIQQMAGTAQGKLVIGAIPTIAPYFLPAHLTRFARDFPHVQIRVVEELTSDLISLLHQGAIDFALLALPVPAAHCACHELFREPLFLVVPSQHRLASLQEASLLQAENDPFLLLKEGHCFRQNTLSICRNGQFQPNVVFECGQFATILAMVAAGAGVSVVPQMAVNKSGGCHFIRLADEGAYRRVGILQLKQHFRSRVQCAFLESLRRDDRRQGMAASQISAA